MGDTKNLCSEKTADFMDGLFFEHNVRMLASLFEEIGEGTLYPL